MALTPILNTLNSVNGATRAYEDDSRKRTDAEIAADVTPVNYAFAPPDLRRYGVDVTGDIDSTSAIEDAIAAAMAPGGTRCIYHPGGNIRHESQIHLVWGLSVRGVSRDVARFTYDGDTDVSAWIDDTNTPNTGGAANVLFRDVHITTTAGSGDGGTNAGIELLSGGASYYKVEHCKINGGFFYGIIIDGCEVSHFRYNIIEPSPSESIAIWLVSGEDRLPGQDPRYTNNVAISRNNLRGDYGIVSDGGSNQWFTDNNFENLKVAMVLANVSGFRITGNEIEGTKTTGAANIQFRTLGLDGSAKGASFGGTIADNYLLAAMTSSSSTLTFIGADYHQAILISGNTFGGNVGAASDIDVTRLANSHVGPNLSGNTVGQHYSGVHNDAYGNTLWPAQNGFAGSTVGSDRFAHGDTRYPHEFYGGVSVSGGALSLTNLGNYANDAAAAAGGVAIGSCYRNGSVVQVRVT
jgi:hypothetical protein